MKHLEINEAKNRYKDIYALKRYFAVSDPKIDAFFSKEGELYFKRKPLQGEEFEPVFTNFFK